MDKIQIALEGLLARNTQDQQRIRVWIRQIQRVLQRNRDQTQQVRSQTPQRPNATRPPPPLPRERLSLKRQAEIIHQ